MNRSACAAAVFCLCTASTASAADLVVEAADGPVVSSQRVTGMGGAFVGLAEGADAHLVNPASFAVRSAFFGHDWFDWDFALAASTVLGGSNDLDRSRDGERLSTATVSQAGLNLKFGRLGVGAHVRSQSLQFRFTQQDATPVEVNYNLTYGGLGTAYALDDGQWVVGALWSVGSTDITNTAAPQMIRMASNLFPYQLGVVHAPRKQPWRAGLALQLPVPQSQRDQFGKPNRLVAALGYLPAPRRIEQPWNLALGGAWQWGDRPLNLRPSFGQLPLPEGARPVDHIPRRYLLATADLVLTGAVDDASIGAPGYLTGRPQEAGRTPTLSARVGVESEVLPNRIALRAGTYFEPSRYQTSAGRLHMTGGADLRVDVGLAWKLSVVFDVAPGWVNTSAGLGLWH